MIKLSKDQKDLIVKLNDEGEEQSQIIQKFCELGIRISPEDILTVLAHKARKEANEINEMCANLARGSRIAYIQILNLMIEKDTREAMIPDLSTRERLQIERQLCKTVELALKFGDINTPTDELPTEDAKARVMTRLGKAFSQLTAKKEDE